MTALATIYRVEDDRGRGLYGSYTCDQTEENESIWVKAIPEEFLWNNPKHPLPFEDGLKGAPGNWKYAFKSVDQLKAWIYEPDWLQGLHNVGGIVKKIVLPAESILEGAAQVMYDPHAVTEIIDVPLIGI